MSFLPMPTRTFTPWLLLAVVALCTLQVCCMDFRTPSPFNTPSREECPAVEEHQIHTIEWETPTELQPNTSNARLFPEPEPTTLPTKRRQPRGRPKTKKTNVEPLRDGVQQKERGLKQDIATKEYATKFIQKHPKLRGSLSPETLVQRWLYLLKLDDMQRRKTLFFETSQMYDPAKCVWMFRVGTCAVTQQMYKKINFIGNDTLEKWKQAVIEGKDMVEVIRTRNTVKKFKIPTTTQQKSFTKAFDKLIDSVGESMPHLFHKTDDPVTGEKRNLVFIPGGIYPEKKAVFDDFKKAELIPSESSDRTLYNLWNLFYPHVLLRKWIPFAKCGECEEYKQKILTGSDMEVNSTKAKQKLHRDSVSNDRLRYSIRQGIAKGDPQNVLSIVMDGMDNSKTQIPKFPTKSKDTEGAGQPMSFQLFGVNIHWKGFFGHWSLPRYAHGSNYICTCLLRTLLFIEEKEGALPNVLYIQADNCGRENKNQTTIALCALLVHMNVFSRIEISFMQVGHTHSDIDQRFSVIAGKILNSFLLIPRAFISLLGTLFTKDEGWSHSEVVEGSIDFKTMLKDIVPDELAGLGTYRDPNTGQKRSAHAFRIEQVPTENNADPFPFRVGLKYKELDESGQWFGHWKNKKGSEDDYIYLLKDDIVVPDFIIEDRRPLSNFDELKDHLKAAKLLGTNALGTDNPPKKTALSRLQKVSDDIKEGTAFWTDFVQDEEDFLARLSVSGAASEPGKLSWLPSWPSSKPDIKTVQRSVSSSSWAKMQALDGILMPDAVLPQEFKDLDLNERKLKDARRLLEEEKMALDPSYAPIDRPPFVYHKKDCPPIKAVFNPVFDIKENFFLVLQIEKTDSFNGRGWEIGIARSGVKMYGTEEGFIDVQYVQPYSGVTTSSWPDTWYQRTFKPMNADVEKDFPCDCVVWATEPLHSNPRKLPGSMYKYLLGAIQQVEEWHKANPSDSAVFDVLEGRVNGVQMPRFERQPQLGDGDE